MWSTGSSAGGRATRGPASNIAPVEAKTRVAAQIGREPRAFLRIAYTCPFGCPAVAEQSPYDENGRPFPTGYYLTCRHLVAAVSRLEAAGGVDRWTKAVSRSRRLTWSLRRANRRQRRRRKQLEQPAEALRRVDGGASLQLGVAGVARGEGLKCLHAHVAFALANPGYRLGRMIAEEIRPFWPAGCCSEQETST